MKDSADLDARQRDILHAAWAAFAAYGFRKTSMNDIARGAGLSRPALYLHYKNKEDIFRSLARFYYDSAEQDFCAALKRPGPVGDVLGEAFLAKSGEIVASMMTSAHGHELMDTKSTNARDIAEAGEARLADILAGWLDAQAENGRVELPGPSAAIARLCLASIKNLMTVSANHDAFVADVRLFGQVVGRGLAR